MPASSNSNERQQAAAQRRPWQAFRAAGQESIADRRHGDDPGLAASLGSIAQEVQAEAAMERAGITGSYSARVQHAIHTMQGPQLAAMLQSLKRERAAALKSLADRTAAELKGRLAAARRRYRQGKPPPPRLV